MALEIRELQTEEYEAALEIWHATGDMSAAMIESIDALKNYLKPNHGLSLVALSDGEVIGTILCGHENGLGRCYQLAVTATEESDNVSKILLGKALQQLHARGVRSCRLALPGQSSTKPFWSAVRWDKLSSPGQPPDSPSPKRAQDKPTAVDPEPLQESHTSAETRQTASC